MIMKSYDFFVGIDISKDTLDFCVVKEDSIVFSSRIGNQVASIRSLLKEMELTHKIDPKKAIFCMEHTGVYSILLLQVLHRKKLFAWLENPAQIKGTLGLVRGKNDKIDSQRIARYASKYKENAKCWKPLPEKISRLKELTKLRKTLLRSMNSLKVRKTEMGAFISTKQKAEMAKYLNGPVKCIQQQIRKIETEIELLVKSDPSLNRKVEVMQSIGGIGPLVSYAIVAETNNFTDFTDPRKFACHCGVVPFENSSGSSKISRPRLSHKANKEMKTLLYLSACAAIRVKNGDLGEYYQRKIKEGKRPISVINAIRNKLIHRIFACVRDDRFYEKNYSLQLA